MEQKRIVISCLAQEDPVADAIAAELGVSLVRCTTGEALAYAKGDADNILAIVAPNKILKKYVAWVYRQNASTPHVLYVEDGEFSLQQLGPSLAILKGMPSVEDLGAWVNHELLPAMGFEPLATIYDRY